MTWIRILGPVEVCAGRGARPAGGVTVPLTSARARRLLAALVSRRGEPASPDWLAEAVWAGDPPANVDAAVQTLVSRLRHVLRQADAADLDDRPAELATVPPGYSLRLAPEQLDATMFERLALAAASGPADRALAAADDALAWWSGAPYAEFADADFARPEATRLRELHAHLSVDRLGLLLDLGRVAEAAAGLEGVVAANPLDERAHALLMTARYRDGRQRDALDLYAALRDRLADELGVAPSAAVQHLHGQILRHEPALDPPVLATALALATPPDDPTPPEPGPGNVPTPRGRLLGRGDDERAAAAAVAPGSLLTLVGPGGVGKTALARAIGAGARDRHPDGVWWCELAAVAEPDAVANAIRTTLAAPPRPGDTTVDRLVDYLGTRRLLLVLDNCEHVVEAAAEVAAGILATCPGVAVLATSRMPLDVAGEQVWPVAPLPAPPADDHELSAIASQPAVRLFVARATARDPAFALDESNAADVAEICRRLDGLPLALELAAARMRSMSPAALADRLSWRFRLLHGGARGGDPRHRTLHAVVNWSYELLDDAARELFRALSAFAGVFTLDDAEELVERIAGVAPGAGMPSGTAPGAVSAGLLDLVDQSMVTVVRDTDVGYQLLDTMRAFGRAKLDDLGAADLVSRAHAQQYADLCAAAVARFFTPSHATMADELASHIDELRAAFTWAIEHDLALATRLVGGLGPYVESRMSAEASQWALRTITACEQQERTPPGLARVHAIAASGARFASAVDEAAALVAAGSRVAADPLSSAYLAYLAAELALFEGRFDDAWARCDEVAALADGGDVAGFADFADVMRALLLAYGGRGDEAVAVADALRRRADDSANQVLAAWAAYTQGEARLDLEPDEALRLLDEAVALAASSSDRYLAGVAIVSAASVRSRHGDPEDALRMFGTVVLHWHDSGNWLHQWTTLRNVVDLLARLGRDEDAAVLIGAMSTRASTVDTFGDEAARFAAAEAAARGRLGEAAFAAMRARGAALRDEEVVSFALAALDG